MTPQIQNERRHADAVKSKAFDLLVGCLLGILVTGAASMYTVGARVSSLEVEVRYLRKDLDNIMRKPQSPTGTLDSSLQENAGNIAASLIVEPGPNESKR